MLYHAILVVHILAGSLGLLLGPFALITKKGGRLHRRGGLCFYYAMLVVAASALFLGVLRDLPFLFAVGIFSGYMNITGYQGLRQKQKGRPNQTGRVERVVSALMGVFSLYFFGYGLYLLLQRDLFGLVFLFFAQSSLRMLWQDWKLFTQRDLQPTTWLQLHITRMVGTCIAAYTAFLVVNSSSRVSLVGWFLPALVGVPILLYWTRKVRAAPSPRVPLSVAS
ncbi:DUF2306 domain-containing protein [Hymenobacter sp. GOD-10R]|uniref:DUF2306 domain-containing protein n=1 Tax=Hymenobacter sp. GOD-10R TaxID=3093922 RepID=UPI002D771B40|nr:DUF2306 domain-containing protein [Hymenobacter sp. GOD-10R]WRQ31795.1 DUF2306 domain-containing protein [Hymenobacter sp. GOD-10R]